MDSPGGAVGPQPTGPRQRLIPLEARTEWEAALRGIPHDFGHGWEGAKAYHLTTGLPVRLYEFVDGDLRVVCPLVERRFGDETDVTTPHGFTGFVAGGTLGEGRAPEAPHGFADHWFRFARTQGWICGYLGLHPLLPNAVELPAAYTYNQVYRLDLRPGMEALHGGLNRNRRRELKAWDASGRSLVRGRAPLTEFLVREYPGFLARVGAPASYHRTPEALRFLCGLEGTLLLGTGTEEEIDSVYVFVHTQTIGTCLHYVRRPEARDHAPVLLWNGARELHARGVSWLNLGGGLQGRDTIARSKERYGAVARPLQAVQQIYRPELYEDLCRRAGVAPDHPGFFPAYRAPAMAPDPGAPRASDADA